MRTENPSAPDRLEDLLAAGEVDAIVCDLDGVLRVFDPGLWGALDEELGLRSGTVLATVLGSPLLADVVRGRAGHAQWRERVRADLRAAGASPEQAAAAVDRWASAPAVIDPQVRDLLLRARAAGIGVLVLTNGTDRVREEVAALDLAEVVGARGEHLLSSHEIGAAKPEEQAYAAARGLLEERMGRALEPGRIVLFDDTAANVEAAREIGWQALRHAPMPHPGAERA